VPVARGEPTVLAQLLRRPPLPLVALGLLVTRPPISVHHLAPAGRRRVFSLSAWESRSGERPEVSLLVVLDLLMMNRKIHVGHVFSRLACTLTIAAVWCLLHGAAIAQEAVGEGAEESGGGAGTLYVVPYVVVIVLVGLGLFVVCLPSRRRERPKDLEWRSATGLAEVIESEEKVPVVTVGMRIEQVNRMLGRPKISRRGAEIYRELFEQGKLSEEDAEKLYLTYETKAGRYDLVVLDKRVIAIKGQPAGPEEQK